MIISPNQKVDRETLFLDAFVFFTDICYADPIDLESTIGTEIINW